MKNKIVQFIGSVGISLLAVSPAAALAANLVVEFENTPLFSEANFLPGSEVTRFAKFPNNATSPQAIIVEAINVSDPDGFGGVLELKITEGVNELYADALSAFFAAGQVSLAELAGDGGQTEYVFTIRFPAEAGNSYQEKSLGFDLLIGFQGGGGEEPEEEDKGDKGDKDDKGDKGDKPDGTFQQVLAQSIREFPFVESISDALALSDKNDKEKVAGSLWLFGFLFGAAGILILFGLSHHKRSRE